MGLGGLVWTQAWTIWPSLHSGVCALGKPHYLCLSSSIWNIGKGGGIISQTAVPCPGDWGKQKLGTEPPPPLATCCCTLFGFSFPIRAKGTWLGRLKQTRLAQPSSSGSGWWRAVVTTVGTVEPD